MKPRIRILSFSLTTIISTVLYIGVAQSTALNLQGASTQELLDDLCAVEEFRTEIDTCTEQFKTDIRPYINSFDGTISNVGACCTLTKMKHCFSYYVNLKCKKEASEAMIQEIFKQFDKMKPLKAEGVTDLSCVELESGSSGNLYEYNSDTCVNARSSYRYEYVSDSDVNVGTRTTYPNEYIFPSMVIIGIVLGVYSLYYTVIYCIMKRRRSAEVPAAPGGSQYVKNVLHPYRTL